LPKRASQPPLFKNQISLTSTQTESVLSPDQRRLIMTEINLESNANGILDDRLDDGLDDLAAVHGWIRGWGRRLWVAYRACAEDITTHCVFVDLPRARRDDMSS
jgi:hypothetical protein